MKQNLLLAGCLIIIGVLIALILRPVPKPEIVGDLTPAQEQELKVSITVLEHYSDSLLQELEKSKAKGKVDENAFNKEIQAKSKTIADLKARPTVIEFLEENAEVDSLVAMQDATIVFYEDRIVELTDELQQRDEINAQIKENLEQRLKLCTDFLADKSKENEQLAKQNRKLRRKLFLTKVAGVVVLCGVVALSL